MSSPWTEWHAQNTDAIDGSDFTTNWFTHNTPALLRIFEILGWADEAGPCTDPLSSFTTEGSKARHSYGTNRYSFMSLMNSQLGTSKMPQPSQPRELRSGP